MHNLQPSSNCWRKNASGQFWDRMDVILSGTLLAAVLLFGHIISAAILALIAYAGMNVFRLQPDIRYLVLVSIHRRRPRLGLYRTQAPHKSSSFFVVGRFCAHLVRDPCHRWTFSGHSPPTPQALRSGEVAQSPRNCIFHGPFICTVAMI
jgi:hypothetical protein